ncbi:MAG: cytochrome c [Gallionella sp.]
MKIILMLALLSIPVSGLAKEQGIAGLTAHDIVDNRTTLKLSPRMKHRLLSNMRAQMAATQTIIGLLAEEKFNSAESTARAKLGMTEDLKQIYDKSQNEDFKKLGLAAHSSANELANTLQTKDLKGSLQALRKTMGFCVQCHRKFRQ